jgi:hypothetical protein
VKKVLGLVVLFGSCLVLAFAAAPDLLRDSAHQGHWQPTTEWIAEKAKCTRYTFVVSNCAVTAVRRASPSGEKRDLSYLTFADWGGQGVQFVHSTKDPNVISLRQAVDGMTGRWAFFLSTLGLMAGVGAAGAASLRPRPA